MADATGEAKEPPLRVAFDRSHTRLMLARAAGELQQCTNYFKC